MAMTLKLVRLDDSAADIDAVDLTAGGYSLALDGYQPAVASDTDASVSESITLNIQSTSVDGLATLVQALDTKIKQVGWWVNNQNVERYQVWLRVGLNGETNTRQAMILSIKPPDSLPLFNRLIDNNNLLASYTFSIERTPFWEDPYAYPTTTTKTGISLLGGKATLSETINGDVPARIAKIAISSNNTSNELFFGWRSSRLGTIANLTPIWRVVDAWGNNPSYTALNSDSTAYSGQRLNVAIVSMRQVNPTGFIYCSVFSTSTNTASPANQRGVFTVLARAKMSDGTTTAYLRQGYGYIGDYGQINAITYRSRKYISGTSWKLYSLGNVSFPPEQSSNVLDYAGIQLEASLIAGGGELEIDCLVLIPRAEGFASLNYTNTVSNLYSAVLKMRPDGRLYGHIETTPGGLPNDSVTISDQDWALPANADSPALVIAGQSSTGSSLSDTATITYTYIPRWRTLRGTVT